MKANTIEIVDRDAMREERLKPDDYRGATPERLRMALGHVHIADDRMGHRIHHLLDGPVNKIYARLASIAKTEDQKSRLGVEYAGLSEYYRCFDESGMLGNVGSIDFERTYSPTPFDRSFLSKTEKQLDDRDRLYFAKKKLGHQAAIVVDNILCFNASLEEAGYCIGKNSKTRAITAAEMILRNSGYKLAEMWGLTAGVRQ